MTTNSTFYSDGYRDATNNTGCNPPDSQVYRNEYLKGFADAQEKRTTSFGLGVTDRQNAILKSLRPVDIHNITEPNWAPLERAILLAGFPAEVAKRFMWMCEQPAGVHQYKHSDTRNYANLRADSTRGECIAQLNTAMSMERTWGKEFDRRLQRA